jgi:flagellar biogenesis protein FliO
MIFSLAIVLGLMFVLLLVMKKYFTNISSDNNSTVPVNVLGYKTIQPKKSIIVVHVLNKVLVLSSTENGITLLTEFSGKETAKIKKNVMEADAVPHHAPASFSQYFSQGVKNILPKFAEGKK